MYLIFYNNFNAQILFNFSDRVVRGELCVTSTPSPKPLAIYLVLVNLNSHLFRLLPQRLILSTVKSFIHMLIAEETQVVNSQLFPPEVNITSSCIVYNVH